MSDIQIYLRQIPNGSDWSVWLIRDGGWAGRMEVYRALHYGQALEYARELSLLLDCPFASAATITTKSPTTTGVDPMAKQKPQKTDVQRYEEMLDKKLLALFKLNREIEATVADLEEARRRATGQGTKAPEPEPAGAT